MFVASKHEKKHVFERGLAVAKKLCEHSDSGIAHLWYGVLLGTVLKSASYKRQLEICPEVGVHLQLAIEMLPDSFDALHGYGRYLYEISDLSGVLKTILKLAHRGHKLPNCSYEEALKIFLRAEARKWHFEFYSRELSELFKFDSFVCSVKPESLSVNTLYIGKCYMHLHQREQAIPYLKTAANWKARFADDENAKKEAKTLLAQIGIKHWEN